MGIPQCSCTLSWCLTSRRNGAAQGMLTFTLPKGHAGDPVKREKMLAKRKHVESILRPGMDPIPEGQKARFLHWHLHPCSFEWKNSFSHEATRCQPGWIVSDITVKSTKQTPPPQGKHAKWDAHDWREIQLDDGKLGRVVIPGSVSNCAPSEPKSTKRSREALHDLLGENSMNKYKQAKTELGKSWVASIQEENMKLKAENQILMTKNQALSSVLLTLI